jgi:hypothetical protein
MGRPVSRRWRGEKRFGLLGSASADAGAAAAKRRPDHVDGRRAVIPVEPTRRVGPNDLAGDVAAVDQHSRRTQWPRRCNILLRTRGAARPTRSRRRARVAEIQTAYRLLPRIAHVRLHTLDNERSLEQRREHPTHGLSRGGGSVVRSPRRSTPVRFACAGGPATPDRGSMDE